MFRSLIRNVLLRLASENAKKTPGNILVQPIRAISKTTLNSKEKYGRLAWATSAVTVGVGVTWLNHIFHNGAIPSVESKTKRSARYNFIADAVELAAPSVVYIEVQGRHPYHGRLVTVSNGSGFIVREDGLILTNAHVVGNNRAVKVTLQNGNTYEAHVEAVDVVSDLATVRIKETKLPCLYFGDSHTVRPGEWVVAMGSPLSLNNTVTAGIVSTVHRKSKELGLNKDMDYIQTDAVINDGEVVGINTMKITSGISFAIPADYAKSFLEKAEQTGKGRDSKRWISLEKDKPKKQYIGVTMLTLTRDILDQLKHAVVNFPDVESGVLVQGIVVGSPAYHGGLRPGDVIIQINGKDVKATADVFNAVETNSQLHVTIRRDSNTVTLTVVPEEVN